MNWRKTSEQPPHVSANAYALVILAIALPASTYSMGFWLDTAFPLGRDATSMAGDIVQLLSLLTFVVLLLTYATTLFSAPFVSIVLACLGWECLLILNSVNDLTRTNTHDGLRLPAAVFLPAAVWLDALAVILAAVVACRRPTLANWAAASIVLASALAAGQAFVLAHIGE